jgi:hypothetical protein
VNGPQRLVLQAATADRATARRAWRELVDTHDLADLWDDEVYRQLPLVWHRLGDDVGAEHVDRLKGSYRKAWVTNQHLVRHGGEVVEALRADGIEPLLVGGAPVGRLFYEDPATRPLRSVGLLVRPAQAAATWRRLEALGYRSGSAPPTVRSSWRREPDDDWYRRVGRPRPFDRGTLDVIQVHTTLAPELVTADPEVADVSDLWDRAVGVDLGEVAASTLSPTDHLFRALLLGWSGSGADVGLRRLVDARTIVDRAGVDGAVLAGTALRHRCGRLVGDRIAELDRAMAAGGSSGGREWLAARLRGRSSAAAELVTTTRGLGPVATVARVPDFFVDRWQLARRRHLPLVVAQQVRHRLRH